MEKKLLIAKTNQLLSEYERLEKERLAVLASIKETFPIKEGDKVEIRQARENDVFVRFAYVNKLEVKLRGKDREAKIEFDLQKCKADGSRGQHGDYLRPYQYITRIKSSPE